VRRRNPPSGNATFNNVTIHNLTAGVSDGSLDDNAEHTLHGLTTVSGAADTIVLQVEEHAHVQGLLSASRLAIGLTTAADPASSDPYASSPYEDTPYPELDADGNPTAPERTGFTVDEAGRVRTTGFVVVKQAADTVVLRASTGTYYAFTVDAAGNLSTTGRSLGQTPP
jgi:hypothetical protein